MSSINYWLRSLRTQILMASLAVLLGGLWSLSFYVTQALRSDMKRLLGEQQSSTASILAAQIDGELISRVRTLEKVAFLARYAMEQGPAAMDKFIAERQDLKGAFSGSIVVHHTDGSVVTDYPMFSARRDTDYLAQENIAAAINDGKSSVGKPSLETTFGSPSFTIAVPLRDATGRIVGALVAEVKLAIPGFLDGIVDNRYGNSGKYRLIAPEYRTIVASSGNRHRLETLSELGLDLIVDRFLSGNEKTFTYVNRSGVEMLSSAEPIPSANWLLLVEFPTEEAFAPIRNIRQRFLVATILLTVLACGLVWMVLRRQLGPLLNATQTVENMALSGSLPTPLRVVHDDEIGKLIRGFNRLLKTLGEREVVLKQILDTSSVAIFLIGMDGRLSKANQRMADMFNCTLETLAGEELVALFDPAERDVQRQEWNELLSSDAENVDLDRLFRHRQRTAFWGHLTAHRLYDDDGRSLGLVGVIDDIDERKQTAERLERMAHYDVLTTLPNRVLLAEYLHDAMSQTKLRGLRLAVVYLDIDGFKAINDTHGHSAGDQMLVALAQRMKGCLRGGDTLARLGGDEFVAILMGLNEVANGVPLLMRLLAAAAQPVEIGEVVVQVTASLGVTFYPQAVEVDADQLLRQSDQAMYQSKLSGKNCFHVFDSDQDRDARGRHESLDEIRKALSCNAFLLYFQPKVNMRTGTIIGAEALIRWQHPTRGLLLPAAFLPVVENHDMSIAIGEWVIHSALSHMERWHAEGLNIPVSVNVGAHHLQNTGFVDRLSEILAAHPAVNPINLEIEVLETSALKDVARVSQTIKDCRELGVQYALDDFGTGYSSLTYLKNLPVSTLKIDQSFIRDMLDDPDDLAILEGIINLANTFQREVVAEGVESVAHGALLLQLGCEKAQGYEISRPMPAEQMAAWVNEWNPDASWRARIPVKKENIPILFARVEHRYWIASVENHLRGELAVMPQLDLRKSRFGTWLDTEGQARFADQGLFRAVEQTHRQIQSFAVALCQIRTTDGRIKAVDDLAELEILSNRMQEDLRRLAESNQL